MTLREVTPLIFNRKTLALWLAVSGVCALAGPFETYEAPFAPRAGYWLVTVGLAILMSVPMFALAHRTPPFADWPDWVVNGLVGVVFGVVYAAVSLVPLRLFFGAGPGLPGYWNLTLYATPIAIVTSFLVALFRPPEPEAAPNADPRLFDRLKPGLGRDLVRMSMQDHYVEVTTRAGSQLILLRFTDALAEAEGVAGWRIHRSHWVAEAGLSAIHRTGGKVEVETRDGARLPVSRTYLPALRAAGVLGRGG